MVATALVLVKEPQQAFVTDVVHNACNTADMDARTHALEIAIHIAKCLVVDAIPLAHIHPVLIITVLVAMAPVITHVEPLVRYPAQGPAIVHVKEQRHKKYMYIFVVLHPNMG